MAPPESEGKPATTARGFDMPAEEFRRHGEALLGWAAGYLQTVGTNPVLPKVQPGELRQALPASAPVHPEPMETILADFQDLVLPSVTHWNHPRFMAYFSVSASSPGILAELACATLNVNGMLWRSCPAATELEQVTVEWLRQWLGLPQGFFGMILDTASTSTFHAILGAREAADPAARQDGPRQGLALYASEQAYSSVEKGAIAAGIGQRYIRKVPVDSGFRMRPDELDRAIVEDLAAGLTPCCIVATAGTTSTASVDPIGAIAAIAQRHGVWLHVDAAYGGAAAILPESSWILDGAGGADSIVVNPHKWLLTPIDLSVLYTRRQDILRQAFSLVPEYLRTAEDAAVNYMDYGLPLGRRFRALKLWFVFRYFGLEGIQRVIRSHIEWAAELASQVETHPLFELAAPPSLSLVCLRYRGSDEEGQKVLESVNATGRAFLSHTKLNGRHVIRVAIGNIATRREDVQEVWQLLQHKAEEVAAG